MKLKGAWPEEAIHVNFAGKVGIMRVKLATVNCHEQKSSFNNQWDLKKKKKKKSQI